LVKGYSSRSSWGFPKGKINKDESEIDCAIREVYEEIGYDLAGKIIEEDHIQFILKEQLIKLYIVPNISEETKFETRTRKEISKIEWANINKLPTSYQSAKELGSENFFMVIPFVHKLKQWIKQKKRDKWKEKTSLKPTPPVSPYKPPTYESNHSTPTNTNSLHLLLEDIGDESATPEKNKSISKNGNNPSNTNNNSTSTNSSNFQDKTAKNGVDNQPYSTQRDNPLLNFKFNKNELIECFNSL